MYIELIDDSGHGPNGHIAEVMLKVRTINNSFYYVIPGLQSDGNDYFNDISPIEPSDVVLYEHPIINLDCCPPWITGETIPKGYTWVSESECIQVPDAPKNNTEALRLLKL